ncbi:MAG: class I SAM-dependent methyltransferase [Acidobacteriota bacterium]
MRKLLSDRPKLHYGDPEISRLLEDHETALSRAFLEAAKDPRHLCYGPGDEVLNFLAQTVSSQSRTLETGAGLTTLIFALRGTEHICITPSQDEINSIRSCASQYGIDLERVSFIQAASERFLPTLERREFLDLVLMDGKHAFPWPILDWFYSAEALKRGGSLVVDDVNIPSVQMLCAFLDEDPRWRLVKRLSRTTVLFQKTARDIHQVAWHMQPYVMKRYRPASRRERLAWRIRLFLKRWHGTD